MTHIVENVIVINNKTKIKKKELLKYFSIQHHTHTRHNSMEILIRAYVLRIHLSLFLDVIIYFFFLFVFVVAVVVAFCFLPFFSSSPVVVLLFIQQQIPSHFCASARNISENRFHRHIVRDTIDDDMLAM